MSNIIDCLDQLGRTTRVRHATSDELRSLLATLPLTAEERLAMLTRDEHRLHELAGARSNTCCMIHPGDEEDDEDDEEEEKPTEVGLTNSGRYAAR